MNKTDTRADSVDLAQATGHYAEAPVPPALREVFACRWIHRMPAHDAAPVLVVPDGCMDLQFMHDGRLRVAGPDREPQTEVLPAGAVVVGYRFRPGAAAAWLGVPAHVLLNQRVALNDLWGNAKAARWAVDDLAALEQRLAAHRPHTFRIDASMDEAFRLLRGADAPPGEPLVRWLCDRLSLCERTLRRRFDDHFGYGPKTLDRILRYQRFLRLVRRKPPASMAAWAAEAGYADQPHLVRESRRLARRTPGDVLAAMLGDGRAARR
ncbi:DUF6597 domain-containing transcriptional factor [Polyangium jinanense]|uniref:Helix-turn-helix domain-containing protein n=1 Tax=Polyangium jinanense TaxID=2829994 RepID=A0A9X3X0F2_9BACT|nr:DUF6597 domain-containing transcriptional factor [Polyangium jinanense]MDC3955163.1 helix-turn-helix domain-containing protein [Polyangium jinanense]MDC3981464.1 helix-turn-helix domain-containing protein [Polyangium jinanense]